MGGLKRVLYPVLTVAAGILFLTSGLAKLGSSSFKPFVWTLLEVIPAGEFGAGIAARVLIAVELILGAFLVLHLALRRFTYAAALTLLGVFSVYLAVVIVRQGNAGNCGCFGNWLEMSPGAALIKNLIMMAALAYCMRGYRPTQKPWMLYAGATVAMAAVVAPFVVHPPYIGVEAEFEKKPLALGELYEGRRSQPAVDLRKGRHIVALFSLTCPHCKSAAKRMEAMMAKDPTLKFYAILGGMPENLEPFLQESGMRRLPYFYEREEATFKQLAGDYVPQIFWVKDGQRVRRSYYTELDGAEAGAWLRAGQ